MNRALKKSDVTLEKNLNFHMRSKPGREGPVSVMDFGENPWDDFNYRPIVDIVANKKSVYRWF